MNLKTKQFIIALVTILTTTIHAQKRRADKATKAYNYEIECLGIDNQGNNILKVWTYSKKPRIAIEQTKKNAVHGIIFKGFSSSNKDCISQKPLTYTSKMSTEDEAQFFKKFFSKNGTYLKYVSTSTDHNVSGNDIQRVTKRKLKYKVGVIVIVHKNMLRKYLEKENVIKGLTSGF